MSISITRRDKTKKDSKWYRDYMDRLERYHNDYLYSKKDKVSNYQIMKVNYDLFNNKINQKEFKYVCDPFDNQTDFPAKMSNKDISSGKIKTLLGMEMKKPFNWKVVAINAEATTRREQAHNKKIRGYVIENIMSPLRQEIEIKHQEELSNNQLTDDEKNQIRKQMEDELKQVTPDTIKKYMLREYSDPAEIMSQQLLTYLTHELSLKRKFNLAAKHAALSAKSVMYVGILNDSLEVLNINSLRFSYDASPSIEFIEDAEWAVSEHYMQSSEVVKYFNKDLTESEIKMIYKSEDDYVSDGEDLFDTTVTKNKGIKLLHGVWKGLRKLGFLIYVDEEGKKQTKLVDETYVLDTDVGDVKIDWEYIPEVYETWKIFTNEKNLYIKKQPLPGQFKDIDNIYKCKLPYHGVVHDNTNSSPTSIMDRLRMYQYYYDIIMYRIELLMASDKGKKLLMNINMIPDSLGITMKDWQYFAESSPYMWYNPNEEGTTYNDTNNVAKVLDLSLASDIQRYIDLASYIKRQAGESVGITDNVEGQIAPSESVSNTRQSLTQRSYALELFFNTQALFKRNVLETMLNLAKTVYRNKGKVSLTYVLDDMSNDLLKLDGEVLDNNTYGLYVMDSSVTQEVQETLKSLAHAALQAQQINMSDVISLIRQDNIAEAEETLQLAENARKEQEQQAQQAQQQAQEKQIEAINKQKQIDHEFEKELIILKEEEKRKTVVVQSSIMGASFNPDQDKDGNGVNDFLEIAKHGLDADIKTSKMNLDKAKFEHQKKVDEERLKQTKEKLKQNADKMQNNKTK